MDRVIISIEAHKVAHPVTGERTMMKVVNRPLPFPNPAEGSEGLFRDMTKSCLSPSRKNMLQDCTEQISIHNSQVAENCRQRKLG